MTDNESRQTEFAVFCIENVAERLRISGKDVVDALEKNNGLRAFVYPSYETLHTQGKDYIVDEVIAYIRQFNPSFGRKEATA